MADHLTSSTTRRPRLRRLIPNFSPTSSDAPARPHPVFLLVASVWFGLLCAPIELGLVVLQKHFRDGTPGFFQMNRQIVWMLPLFHLLLFGTIGLLLALLGHTWSKFSTRRASFLLGFLLLASLTLSVRSIHPAASLILAAGIAFRASSRIEAACLKSSRLILVTLLPLMGLSLLLVGVSMGREALAESRGMATIPPATPNSPNVLLIVMDTVSAQHMSLYGYSRNTTPNLDRLARKGVRFEQARSTAPWTLPSHASMFTGRWPHELSAGYGKPLDGRARTLAEALRDRGYATGGFIANTLYCSAETGLNRGFLHYEDHEQTLAAVVHSAAFGQVILEKIAVAVSPTRPKSTTLDRPVRPYKDSSRVHRDALRWLATQQDRPVFLFLNLFDAHTPYLLPDGCADHFGLIPSTRSDYSTLNSFWDADKKRLSARDIELARDAYDDCIAHMDEQVGELMDELERRGALQNTVVLITSDHGEQFGEHGLFGHASSLYRGEIDVPLLVVAPGRVPAGMSVREPVSLRNLPATVCDLVGLTDSQRFPGVSLARHWNPSAPAVEPGADPVLSEVAAPAKNHPNQGRSPVFRGSMSSLVIEGKTYIRNQNGHEELYDLDADPAEAHNLATNEEAASALTRARAALDQVLGSQPDPNRSEPVQN